MSARRTGRRLRFGWIGFAVAGAAWPQTLPLTPPFQVNEVVQGEQLVPQTAIAPDRSFVVVWQTRASPLEPAVVGRRFDSAGAPIGGEFAVSAPDATPPVDVEMDAEGEFVVLWGTSYSGPGGGSPSEAFVRRFGADAAPLAEPFQVNSQPATEYLHSVGVAMESEGTFAVVWNDEGQRAQRFDADGMPIGANFDFEGEFYEMAGLPGGGFVAVWSGWSDPPETNFLAAQRYDGLGAPVGEPILVVEQPLADFFQGHRVAADPAGGFVVAWATYGKEAWGLHARCFRADGTALGPPIAIEPATPGRRYEPDVAISPDDTFVASWRLEQAGVPGASLWARRFATDGTALGPRFRIDAEEDGNPRHARVAARGDRLLLAWTSQSSAGTDQEESSVQARLWLLPFFVDGFESGDLGRWTSSQP
jgi:hypothetical protein